MDFAALEKGKTMAKEYIEREKLLQDIEHYHLSDGKFQHWVEIQPAADVVPAVRCQDCVYAHPLKDSKYDYLCHYWNGHSCNQNQFCSQGKRKEKTK